MRSVVISFDSIEHRVAVISLRIAFFSHKYSPVSYIPGKHREDAPHPMNLLTNKERDWLLQWGCKSLWPHPCQLSNVLTVLLPTT
jgi:hypothetical protein